MGSRKKSAWAKEKAAFAASLDAHRRGSAHGGPEPWDGGADDPWDALEEDATETSGVTVSLV